MHIHAASSQPPQSHRRPGSSTPTLRGRILRQNLEIALCLAVLLADQASKAVRPPGTFIVNTGGAAIVPAAVGDALWKSPTLGTICDRVDLALLLGALILTRKLCDSMRRAAGIAALAGLLSNLADRLGASSLFHAGLPRGSIDWIPVPLWPAARTNLADIVIALAAVAFAYQPARRAIHALRTHMSGMTSAANGWTPLIVGVTDPRKALPPAASILARESRRRASPSRSAARRSTPAARWSG